MDVSSPFADVKQISVQNKPLGGKVKRVLILVSCLQWQLVFSFKKFYLLSLNSKFLTEDTVEQMLKCLK